MTARSRRLERQVSEVIEREAEIIRREAVEQERANRAHDIRSGVLSLHQPHAQPPQDGLGEPLLYCTGCASTWPCETVQFLFTFGKYAEQGPND